MQNKQRNKYTNKALKQGHQHYNDYQGNSGYIQVNKGLSVFTLLKILFIVVIVLIVTFYLLTK